MNLYKVVSGVLVVGAGQVVQLTKEQAAPRHHKLKPLAGEPPYTVEAIEPLQFIVGEELGIADLQIVQQPFVVAIGGELAPGTFGLVGESGPETVKPVKTRTSR